MSVRLDHLVYAAPDLERAVDEIEALVGVRAAPGGRHLEEGTRNAILGLGGDSYLEILAPDPSQRRPDRPLWLGVEGLSRPRLTAWAVKGSELEALVERARAVGVHLGGVQPGLRKRPDGTLLEWEFTDPHVVAAGGLVPFAIDWKSAAHPAAGAPAGVSLVALRAEHPDPAGVAALLRGLGLSLRVTKGRTPALIANLETPRGLVELR